MAVLLLKTMGQLNEDRKSVYPLFQKSSKVIKPDKSVLLQETIDAPTILENVPRKPILEGIEEPSKTVKDDPKSLPTSNFDIVILEADKLELLDIDPNSGRRKRQKTTSPKEEEEEEEWAAAGKIETIQSTTLMKPRPGRQRNLSSSIEIPVAIEAERSTIEKIATLEQEVLNGSGLQKREPEEVESFFGVGLAKPLEQLETEDQGIQKDFAQQKRLKEVPKSAEVNIKDRTITPEALSNDPLQNKPTKILHFNPRTGTIGSPPAKKVIAPVNDIAKLKSSSRAKRPKSKLVTIRYGLHEGSTSTIGLQIDQILKGITKLAAPPEKVCLVLSPTKALDIDASKTPKPTSITPLNSRAALHPFFSNRRVAKHSPAMLAANVIDLEYQEQKTFVRRRAASSSKPPLLSEPPSFAFTGFPGLGSTSKVLKFPGAIEPSWPWKGMVHIRGDKTVDEQPPIREMSGIRSKSRKSKYQAIEIMAEEDIIGTFATKLCIGQVLDSIKDASLDNYPKLPSCLRAPTKHFESGYDLQKRVRKELHAQLPHETAATDEESSEDEIQKHDPSRSKVHLALSRAYATIATSLTAFDQFSYETQPWTQKHMPKSAAQVLQTGREAMILKEWLQKLIVLSVETGSSDRPNSRASSVSRRSTTSKSDLSGKRKRKSKNLDGFVVSSDEETNDMDEISEPEDDISPRGSQGLLKKTVIRAGDAVGKGLKDAPRLNNAVVISGPHGCGKTAAVYAVAKELGFEVFEINSSSRRNGKDILEKVGDMTRNHQVQRSNTQEPTEPLDEDAQRISDALADDIMSGRQGTMNSFFKVKDAANLKPKPKKSKPAVKTSAPIEVPLGPKLPPKQQKQSLILLEEVDVLYEEDKQFWMTVITLIAQSKRPVIMTCQDESAVPIQSLSLYAILRFTAPPIELATDYMLLVAANEGHSLERYAVKSLYQSRHFDLRASLTELNFWCQFAVGDFKRGLDWFCPRWPLGCDVDKHGNKIRVFSEKTYEAGMGWLSQDFLESHMRSADIEEEILREAWDGWDLDLGNWQKSIDLTGWANKSKSLSTGKADDRAWLSIYDDFADTMSTADLCSGSAFASNFQIQLDVTTPQLSDKVREDYLVDRPLLETFPLLPFYNTSLYIALWMKSLARKNIQLDQHIKHGFEVPSELERPSESRIIGLIRNQISSPEVFLTRQDLSLAFDPISELEKTSACTVMPLEASVFDRTKAIVVIDIAPYVRSIVSYDAKLQQERNHMSNLLSEGGRKGKRMRTTRSAISALEGGARSTTRRDRYFGPGLNPYLVLQTGIPSWLAAIPANFYGSSSTSIR